MAILNDDTCKTNREKLTIVNLPYDILIDIFKFLTEHDLLTSISLVSRLWRELALYSSLGRSLGLKFKAPSDICCKLLDQRPFLRVLRCSALKCLSQVVQQICAFSQLQCLNIGFCELNYVQAAAFACSAPETLIHLNLEGCGFVEASSFIVLKLLFILWPK